MITVSPRNQITAGQLRALTSEFDAILTCAFGGLSWLAFDLSSARIPRAFTVYLGPAGTRFFFPGEPEYDHAPFTAWAAAAVIDEYDDALEIAKVDIPDINWFLDGSLEAHTVEHVPTGGTDPKKYWLAKWFDPTDGTSFRLRERYRRLDTLDVVFDGGTYPGNAFTWPANWDKFHCLRFHNLRDDPLTITLPGGQSFTMSAFGIQAARRDYPKVDNWRFAFRYLWEPISGDQLFWEPIPPTGWSEDHPRFSNLTSLSYFTRTLDLLSSQPIIYTDPSKLWKPSSVSPYPPIADERLFRDYQIAPGTIFSAREASSVTPILETLSWSTWAQLEAGIGDDGTGTPILVATPITGGWTLEGLGTDHDVMGITSDLFPDLKPVTLPKDVLLGPDSLTQVTGATQDAQTVTASWRPNPADPPGDPDSYVDVTVDVPIFGTGQHSAQAGGELTFGETKTWSTAGLVSTVTDISFAWDNWKLTGRGDVFFMAPHAEAIGIMDGLFNAREPWQGGVASQYSLSFFIPYQFTWLEPNADTDVAPIHIPRRLCAFKGFEDAFGVEHYTGHPDIDGDEGLPGGVEWEFDRKEFTTSKIARRGITTGGISTRSFPVRPLGDNADRILTLTPTGYHDQRTDLLAGTITDVEREQLVRIPVCVEQFNIIAGILNSIVFIASQTIDLSTWWDLGSGGSPFRGKYLPRDFGRYADPAGRATLLGLTVLSLTVDHTAFDPEETINYVTKANLQAQAIAKGWPYSASSMELPYVREPGENLGGDDFGEVWRRVATGEFCTEHSMLILAEKWTKIDTAVPGGGFPPFDYERDLYATTPGYPIQDTLSPTPAVRIAEAVALHSPPTGWQIARDSRLVTRPVASIIYDHVDPIPVDVVLDTIERIVQPAEASTETRAWLLTYILGAIGSDTITRDNLSEDLYEETWAKRAATLLTLVPRVGYTRTA